MKHEDLTEEYFMPGDWLEIANKILKDRGAVLVLGATDTGKSICTLLFANFWAKEPSSAPSQNSLKPTN